MRKIFFSIIALSLVQFSLYSQQKKTTIIRDSVVDQRDNKVYKMIKFGNQTWMIENLRFECEGSFVYEELPKNLKKYGRLYTIDAAKSACPAGTHLPSKQEWDSLRIAVDPKDNGDAGDKLLKKTGFSATLSGYRNGKGKYAGIEDLGCYWGTDNAISLRGNMNGVDMVIANQIDKKDAKNCYSVRCVKDEVK
jgi:uncharacterized protein (TIGR02145 family)